MSELRFPEPDPGAEPTMTIETRAGLVLEFSKDDPYGPDDPWVTGLLVRVRGEHVRIEHPVILLGARELPTFLGGLYDDFRGWDGERVWTSLEGELAVTARHDGHVHLRWDLRHQPWEEGTWTFSTTTDHGAGEDVRRLADGFEGLLDPAR